MKYSFGELFQQTLYQDLSTHNYDKMWRYHFLYMFCAKDIVLNKKLPVDTKDIAALYALACDWGSLPIEDIYNLFNACKDSTKKDWHRTCLDMARKYVADSSAALREQSSKFLYARPVRIISPMSNGYITNDPTLQVLIIKNCLTINVNQFANNENLCLVVIENCAEIKQLAFNNCPNLEKVVIIGNPSIASDAIPSTAKIVKEGAATPVVDTAEVDRLKKALEEIRPLQEELSKAKETITQITAELNDYKERSMSKEKAEEVLKIAMGKTSQIESLTKERDEATSSLSEAQEALNSLRNEKDKLISEATNLRSQNETLQTQLSATEAKAKAEIDAISVQLQATTEEYKALKDWTDSTLKPKEQVDMSKLDDLSQYVPEEIIQGYFDVMDKQIFHDFITEENRLAHEILDLGVYGSSIPEFPSTLLYKQRYSFYTKYPLADRFFPVEAIFNKIQNDPSYEEQVFKPNYEKACILYYKYGVENAVGKDFDELIKAHENTEPVNSDVGYVRAMNTLTNLLKEGRLSTRHIQAIRDLVNDTVKNESKHEEILQTIEQHGYSESDYNELYEECKHSISPTEVKYTAESDMDSLIAERMPGYLEGDRVPVQEKIEITVESIEQAIREQLGLEEGTDVSDRMADVNKMADILYVNEIPDRMERMMKVVEFLH